MGLSASYCSKCKLFQPSPPQWLIPICYCTVEDYTSPAPAPMYRRFREIVSLITLRRIARRNGWPLLV